MKYQGFGLLDVCIALLLSSFITIMLMQVYLSAKRQYQFTQKALTWAFDANWIVGLMQDSIRKAGFTPCRGIEGLEVLDHRQPAAKPLALEIIGTKAQTLRIHRMYEQFEPILEWQGAYRLRVAHRHFTHPQRALLIADCLHAEIVPIHSITNTAQGQWITLQKPLHFSYPNKTYVGEWIEELWGIAETSAGENTLYYQWGQRETLAAGITHLHFAREKSLIKITLSVLNQPDYEIFAAIRGP